MIRKLASVVSVAAAGMMPALARGQALPTPPAPRPIVVTVTRSVTVPPDYAVLHITVRIRDPDAARAGEQHAATATRVRAALRDLGFPAESLATVSYTLNPEYDQQRRPTAYAVMSTIEARQHDLARVGRVIDAALGAGANGIANLSFRSTRQEAARLDAIAQAVEAGRQEAEVIARAAGGRLGALLEASTDGGGPVYPRGVMMRTLAVDTPVEPGDVDVAATVTTRWEFVPGRQD